MRERTFPFQEKKRFICDVTVAGGGIAGFCAAIAAAREGLKVVLINDRSVLGGNASSEIGIMMNGASHLGLNGSVYAREGGLVEEIRLRMAAYNHGGGYEKWALLDAVYFDMIYEEKNITLLLNTGVYGCEVEAGRITRCFARHSVSNVVYELESPYFVDATGNGVLAFEAGCSYRMGREGSIEFGEKKAPDVSDSYTMGNTFYFETVDCGHEVHYTPPAFAKKWEEMDFLQNVHKPGNHRGLSVHGAHWSFEYGGQRDIVYDSEDIDLELRRLVYGIWDYIKNSGKYPEARRYALKRVYAKSGARESRRFSGDYVLSQNDIEEKRNFEDAVCVGGWPMDVHAPLGIYDEGPATDFIPVTGIYNIPFRCLYSKEVENLFFAGRNISATHIALGSVRVMATCGCMGQAVGTAAALCGRLGATPRGLMQKYCTLLQETLVQRDQTIVGYADIGDIMQKFTPASDTEKLFENREITFLQKLDRDYGLAIMMETARLDSLNIWLQNASSESTVLIYKILEGDHREAFLPQREIKTMTATVEAGFAGWKTLHTKAQTGPDGKIYLVLQANAKLEAGMCSKGLTGAVTLRLFPEGSLEECNHDSIPLNPESGYCYLEHRYNKEENIAFCEMMPPQRAFAPQMVLSPYTRPYGKTNLWLPGVCGEFIEEGQKTNHRCTKSSAGIYPATLTLTAKEPVRAKMLSIIFDTDLTIEPIPRLPGCLVKDADIRIVYAGKKSCLVQQSGGQGCGGNQTDSGLAGICEQRADSDNTVINQLRGNWRRQVLLPLEEREIIEIHITIMDSWGGEAGIYGVNMW